MKNLLFYPVGCVLSLAFMVACGGEPQEFELELGKAESHRGMCVNAHDAPLLRSDHRDILRESIAAAREGCDYDEDYSNCFNGKLTISTGLSRGCANCFAKHYSCMLTNCEVHCSSSTNNIDCIKCMVNDEVTPPNRNDENCDEDFFTCKFAQ